MMKKHEACYWLNKIIEEKRRIFDRGLEPVKPMQVKDPKTGEMRDTTEQEIKVEQRWRDDYAKTIRMEIEALDMAAASLTK